MSRRIEIFLTICLLWTSAVLVGVVVSGIAHLLHISLNRLLAYSAGIALVGFIVLAITYLVEARYDKDV